MTRVSSDDLAFAVEWLDAYDAAPDDEANGAAAQRVIAWLNAEIDRRAKDAVIRDVARRKGVSTAFVRKAIARQATLTARLNQEPLGGDESGPGFASPSR